jgi:hypothetical protein
MEDSNAQYLIEKKRTAWTNAGQTLLLDIHRLILNRFYYKRLFETHEEAKAPGEVVIEKSIGPHLEDVR